MLCLPCNSTCLGCTGPTSLDCKACTGYRVTVVSRYQDSSPHELSIPLICVYLFAYDMDMFPFDLASLYGLEMASSLITTIWSTQLMKHIICNCVYIFIVYIRSIFRIAQHLNVLMIVLQNSHIEPLITKVVKKFVQPTSHQGMWFFYRGF